MNDQDKTKQQFVEELAELRRRVAELEGGESERKRAEEDLRRSEAKWRSLVGKMPLFTAVIDRSGKIEFHNDSFQPGFTPENVIGKVNHHRSLSQGGRQPPAELTAIPAQMPEWRRCRNDGPHSHVLAVPSQHFCLEAKILLLGRRPGCNYLFPTRLCLRTPWCYTTGMALE